MQRKRDGLIPNRLATVSTGRSRQSLAKDAARARTSFQERRTRLLLRCTDHGTWPPRGGIANDRRTARKGATAGPHRVP